MVIRTKKDCPHIGLKNLYEHVSKPKRKYQPLPDLMKCKECGRYITIIKTAYNVGYTKKLLKIENNSLATAQTSS